MELLGVRIAIGLEIFACSASHIELEVAIRAILCGFEEFSVEAEGGLFMTHDYKYNSELHHSH